MRKNLTAKFVEGVKVEKLTEFWDENLAGFVLRVTPAGTKTFAASYRHHGRPRKITIGTHPTFNVKQARTAAAGYLRDAKAGDNENVADLEKNSNYVRFESYRSIWFGLQACAADMQQWALTSLDVTSS